MKLLLLFLSFMIWCVPLSSVDSDVMNQDLKTELKMMCEKDQEARFEVIRSEGLSEEDSTSLLENVDQMHLLRLKEILQQFGWPGIKLVGEEGADCMWLLVQHCDCDIEFQKICLGLLEEAVRNEDAPKKHLAYLTDRVLVNEGQAQIYGTQIQIVDGKVLPRPIVEMDELDQCREEVGLCPYKEYLLLVKKVYCLK